MSEITAKENKMGTMPIPKLLITMSLPMMVSMLVQAAYNIVDSMFVAKLSEDALTAVSLAFPIQNLMISVAAGTGVGINSLLSRNLGEGRPDEANKAAQNGIFIIILSAILFAIVGGSCSHLFFETQTSNSIIIRYGSQYMFVVTVGSFGIFLQIVFERLLQSTGRTIYNMYTQGLGAIINIILDPILIFGLGPFPKLEVLGAAIATITGQLIAVMLSLYFNIKKNRELNINMKGFRPNRDVILAIYKVGLPSIFMQAIGSVMVFGMNKILLLFSTTAAAVYGVYFKLQSFIFMPIFGLTNGMIPIVAYNYGAKNKKRIYSTLKLSLIYASSIMLIGLIVFQFFAAELLSIFDASDSMLDIGVPALRIISISFIVAGFCIIISSMFQALGNGVYSLIMSAGRQLAVILPVAYFFAKTFGLHMVWWAVPVAEIISLSICVFFLIRINRLKLKNL
ncbi:MATE family efflux transporter [Lachnospiraceae bacterium OttesenSCG-928-E19]|nr:MATE family efflux transporter [Lachnospiraceae bacterium OttesenSCG-928-E19]